MRPEVRMTKHPSTKETRNPKFGSRLALCFFSIPIGVGVAIAIGIKNTIGWILTREALLDRFVAMLTKLGQRDCAVRKSKQAGVDPDSDPDFDMPPTYWLLGCGRSPRWDFALLFCWIQASIRS